MHKLIHKTLLLLMPLMAACNLATAAPQDDPSQENPPTNTAPSGEWSAYLSDPRSGELIRISADGTQTIYNLDLPNSAFVSSYDMSFSDDGNRVAFCQTAYNPDPPQLATATLYVHDLAANSRITTVDLGTGDGKTCSMGRHAYVGNQVAVALMNYSPFSVNPDTSLPMWEVRVLDATTGETLNSINSTDNPISLEEELGATPTLPLVQRFDGAQVSFTFVPYGGDGSFNSPAFAWNVESGAVEPVPYLGQYGIDMLDTGEMAFPDFDESLPVGTPMGPIGTNNIVSLVDGGEPRTIYHSPDWIIGSTRFINHGQQLAIWLLPTFDPELGENNPTGTRWIALDRQGNVSELFESPYYADILPAPNGYLALTLVYDDPSTMQGGMYTLTYYANGTETVLWQGEATIDETWELAWSAPTEIASDLAAFPTINP